MWDCREHWTMGCTEQGHSHMLVLYAIFSSQMLIDPYAEVNNTPWLEVMRRRSEYASFVVSLSYYLWQRCCYCCIININMLYYQQEMGLLNTSNLIVTRCRLLRSAKRTIWNVIDVSYNYRFPFQWCQFSDKQSKQLFPIVLQKGNATATGYI